MKAVYSGNKRLDQLVAAGHPVGEVIAVDQFLARVRGLQPCSPHAIVLFEDGSKGFVHQILSDHVLVLHLGGKPLKNGMVAVIQSQALVCKVGRGFIGRVVSVTGEPLDGKGPIAVDATWPVFGAAPAMHERRALDTQLESGVIAIDSLFPIVRGQRMAMLGDSKSGKSALLTQLTINQKDTNQIVVYALIAKRRSDIDILLTRLEQTGGLKHAIVMVSTMLESLVMSYLAPYTACAMAEYLWRQVGQDTIIIYDDLTSHAHACREIALLSGVSPGRDSYPGDIFYAHSSLLERAGRLSANGAHLTSIPIVNIHGGDVTAYLPTNVMSITDGQWILDMDMFRKGLRPALSLGLSVTRVGSAGSNRRQKLLAAQTLKLLADYREAEEFSHFDSELALEARYALARGKRIFQLLTQAPTETYSLMAQQLMLDVALNAADDELLDMRVLKRVAVEIAPKITDDSQYESMRDQLKAACLIELKGAPAGRAAPRGSRAANSAPEAAA